MVGAAGRCPGGGLGTMETDRRREGGFLRILLGIVVVAAALGSAGYHVLFNRGEVPAESAYELDIGELRRLAAPPGAALPLGPAGAISGRRAEWRPGS